MATVDLVSYMSGPLLGNAESGLVASAFSVPASIRLGRHPVRPWLPRLGSAAAWVSELRCTHVAHDASAGRAIRIAVVGAGGIGSLFGGRLAAAGHEVWLVHRRAEHVTALRADGLLLDAARIAVHATTDTSEIGPVDLVLVLTKTTDTHAAAQATLPLLAEDTIVLTLQNGLGNMEIIGSVVGAERVLVGMTYHGASLDAPGVARHTAVGQTFLGEPSGALTPRVRTLADAFTAAGLPTEATDRLWSMVWGKLIVNAALNASAALMAASGGDILQSASARRWVGLVAHECAAVAAALGIELPYPDAAERVWQHCATVGPAKPSMLQDVERKRPTEIEAINGAIVREGQRLGIPTPFNEALLLLIKGREDVAAAASMLPAMDITRIRPD
jgi:2-dehydropantoate 2-reductase